MPSGVPVKLLLEKGPECFNAYMEQNPQSARRVQREIINHSLLRPVSLHTSPPKNVTLMELEIYQEGRPSSLPPYMLLPSRFCVLE